jgi:hypothetical protein
MKIIIEVLFYNVVKFFFSAAGKEVEILKRVTKHDPKGCKCVIHILDCFCIDTENGKRLLFF